MIDLQLLYTGIIVLILLLVFFYLINKISKALVHQYFNEKNINSSEFIDLMQILEGIMDAEMKYQVDLPFEGKDIQRITNFEEIVHDLTTGVVKALSPFYIKKMEACGFSEDYVYDYITRGCTLRVMNYMDKHRAGYKAEESENTVVEI
jgi:hypothetical protein